MRVARWAMVSLCLTTPAIARVTGPGVVQDADATLVLRLRDGSSAGLPGGARLRLRCLQTAPPGLAKPPVVERPIEPGAHDIPLAPGTWRLEVEAEQRAPIAKIVRLGHAEATVFLGELELRAGGRIEGVVLGHDREPAAGVTVFAWHAQGSARKSLAASQLRRVRTDALGRYHFDHLAPGAQSVCAADGRRACIGQQLAQVVDGETLHHDMEFREAGELELRLRTEHEAAPRAVRLTVFPGRIPGDSVGQVLENPLRRPQSFPWELLGYPPHFDVKNGVELAVGEQGFHSVNLAPGDHVVWVHVPGRFRHWEHVVVESGHKTSLTMTLKAGKAGSDDGGATLEAGTDSRFQDR